MTESKEREPSPEALAAVRYVDTMRDKALALEDCVDARIRRALPTDCEPRECHKYQTELIAERDKLKAEVATLDEELQQIDDLVEELGGSRDRGPVAFIRDLHVERNAARADRDRLQRDLAAMTEQLTLAVKMNDEIHAADRTANELRAAFTAEKAAHEATRKELANMTKSRDDWARSSGRLEWRAGALEAEIESLLTERDELRAQLENEKSAQPERVRLLGNASRLALEWTEERAKLRAELHEMSVACAQWRDAFQSLHTASLAEKAAHEATKRELDALTNQDFLKYHMKAKAYGEMAYKWRKRCVDAGLASEEDRILADEWQGREKALAEERAAHEATRIKLNEARSAVAVGDSTFAGLNAELGRMCTELAAEQRNKVDIKAAHVAECERHAATLRVAVEDCELAAKERDEARANVYAIGAKLESLRLAHDGALASIQAERDAQAEMRADMLTMEAELESLRSKPLEAELAGALLKDCEYVHHSTQDDFAAHAAFSRVESALRNALRSRGSADVVPLEGELAACMGKLSDTLTDWVHGVDSYRQANEALGVIEAALRAKGAELTDIDHLEQGCAEAFVSLEARARAGEQLAVHQSEWLSAEAARLRAKGAQEQTAVTAEALANQRLLNREDYYCGACKRQMPRPEARAHVCVARPATTHPAEPPYRCGVMVCGEKNARCALESDHDGEHVFETPEPRPIVVGSKWLDRSGLGPSHSVEVTHLHEDGGGLNLLKDTGWRFSMTTIAFRHAFKWLSDPPATAAYRCFMGCGAEVSEPMVCGNCYAKDNPVPCAQCGKPVEPARHCYAIPTCYACLPPPPPIETIGLPGNAAPTPELPRKVEPGTTLTVGAKYRITGVSPGDSSPRHKVGDELLCRPEDSDTPGLYTQWFLEEYWFASDGSAGTFVTGLDLIADAPKAGR